MIRFLRPALVAALLLATASEAASPAKKPMPVAPRDWTQVMVRTPDGDRMGNPAARVKLVEMLSLTCPHCAVFEAEAVPKLVAKYVKSGKVSYEVRLALRDPIDLAAAIGARCQGPRDFFRLKPILFRAQNDWLSKGYAWMQTNPNLEKGGEAAIARTTMQKSGLDILFTRNGLAPAAAQRCVDNVAEQSALADRAKRIWAIPGFGGTPGFMVDGKLRPDIVDWYSLDAALQPLAR